MTDGAPRVAVGRIVAAHGVRGDVLVHSFTADPADVGAYGPLSLDDRAGAVSLAVRRVTPKGVIAHLDGVDDRDAAERLKGSLLYVPRERLPEAEADSYYHADLVGLEAHRPDGRRFGTVVAVQNFGAGDLLEIAIGDGRATEFIPFTNAFVPEVDVAARRLTVSLAESDDAGA